MKPNHIKLAFDSKAFRTGFLDGLGAPALLFSDFRSPTIQVFCADLNKPPSHAVGGLAQDWSRIGGDFRVAVERHGKAA
ncbi:MAG: hypothetical protein Q8L69_01540 [Gallionellaceae bacterium]|nr:hypothetical protein [Gallionellaceae bacterium]